MGASVSKLSLEQLAVAGGVGGAVIASYYLQRYYILRTLRPLVGPAPRSLQELNLSNRGLVRLPESLANHLPKLTLLNIGGNPINSLPASFSKLANLQILFCLGCHFESVPEVLKNLPSLYMLSFKSNRLTEIPEGRLNTRITWLILTDNKLKALPRDIGSLHGLRKFMCTGNELESLPDDIVNCRSLELVRMADNKLTSLPEGFLDLPKLAWVALSGNPIVANSSADVRNHCTKQGLLKYEDLTVGKQLGRGAGGTVSEALWQGTTVVVKEFHGSGVTDGKPENEQAAWQGVPRHENIPECLATFTTPRLGCVFEFLEGLHELGKPPTFVTCTRDVFKDELTITAAQMVKVSLDVSRAVQHMHKHGFCHGDVYAHNTLVDDAYKVVKLGDLGAAFFCPPHLRDALQKLEVRALGCLIGDMMQIPVPPGKNTEANKATRISLGQLAGAAVAKQTTVDDLVAALDKLHED